MSWVVTVAFSNISLFRSSSREINAKASASCINGQPPDTPNDRENPLGSTRKHPLWDQSREYPSVFTNSPKGTMVCPRVVLVEVEVAWLLGGISKDPPELNLIVRALSPANCTKTSSDWSHSSRSCAFRRQCVAPESSNAVVERSIADTRTSRRFSTFNSALVFSGELSPSTGACVWITCWAAWINVSRVHGVP